MTDTIAIAFNVRPAERAIVSDAIGGVADPVYLTDLDPAGRIQALRDASAILAYDTGRDLNPEEIQHIRSARLIQFMTAGIDYVNLNALPPGIPVASNGGAEGRQLNRRVEVTLLGQQARQFE